jgi:hypothetical protein
MKYEDKRSSKALVPLFQTGVTSEWRNYLQITTYKFVQKNDLILLQKVRYFITKCFCM